MTTDTPMTNGRQAMYLIAKSASCPSEPGFFARPLFIPRKAAINDTRSAMQQSLKLHLVHIGLYHPGSSIYASFQSQSESRGSRDTWHSGQSASAWLQPTFQEEVVQISRMLIAASSADACMCMAFCTGSRSGGSSHASVLVSADSQSSVDPESSV